MGDPTGPPARLRRGVDGPRNARKAWSDTRITTLRVYQPGCDIRFIPDAENGLFLGPYAQVEGRHATLPQEGGEPLQQLGLEEANMGGDGGLVDGQDEA